MWWSKPKIEFMCREEDFGAIAKPVPASKAIPDWYKGMTPADTGKGVYTFKRCVPALEALSAGWIIPVPADIIVTVSEDGTAIDTEVRYTKPLISSHIPIQMKGSPWAKRPVIKIETQWCVRTSPGWSCLYTKPMNTQSDLEPFSGIIETDTYNQPVVIPLCLSLPDGVHVIEKGTPLVQVIPFRRERLASKIRASTQAERAAVLVQYNAVLSQAGWYRKFIWGRN